MRELSLKSKKKKRERKTKGLRGSWRDKGKNLKVKCQIYGHVFALDLTKQPNNFVVKNKSNNLTQFRANI